MSNDRFEFRIIKDKDGSNTNLNSMSLNESKAFLVLLDSIIQFAESLNLAEAYEIKIEKGSACVAIESADLDPLIVEYDKVINNESNNSELVTAFRNVQNLFWENGLQYDSKYVVRGLSYFDIYSDISKAKSFRTKSISKSKNIEVNFLNGYLQEIGGKNPNFHLLKDGKTIKIECSIEQAQRIKHELYREIHISVVKKSSSSKSSYKFIDYYPDKEIYKEFRNLFESIYSCGKIDAIRLVNSKLTNSLKDKDYLKARSIMKLVNHEFIDNNILKTVLILTKSIPNNGNILAIRDSIKKILEKKRGELLI